MHVETILEESSNDDWEQLKTNGVVVRNVIQYEFVLTDHLVRSVFFIQACETFNDSISFDNNLAVCGLSDSIKERDDEAEENPPELELLEPRPGRDDVIKALDCLELHSKMNDVSLEFIECFRRVSRDCLEHSRRQTKMKQTSIRDFTN
ncbi:hypothetical protein QAD02_007270 [Eretmocerus hayati]|uniref:Uncharacterized protein n=1 Tax=Eretmocerus hayati TaxID=131215 RepID=A0ACC2N3R1_9HYME|nr:hypothetical protein QAD02_007270 [Eretmocerus hayati]